MGFQKLDDIEIDGVKITNIYRGCEYYFRTSGYNYVFYFRCDITDENTIYELCKKAFPEGKNHIKYDGSIGTYAVDHDRVQKLTSENAEYFKKGCNWVYYVNEGNDD